jgi:membrane protein DedA with SNARE-associated domain
MHDTLTALIGTYGYYVVFALVAVESFGIPLPGETSLVTAAAFAALGRLSLVGVILAASAGAIVGDNAGYWIGRKGGIALVRCYGARFGLDDEKLERARGFFERHGAKTVFIGRFVALLRSWAAALAGVSRMSYGTFMLWNALGGVAWSLIFGALGYLFGRNLPRLEKYVGQLSLALVLLLAMGVVLFFVLRWFRGHEESVSERLRARWCSISSASRFARLRARYPRTWAFVAARFSRGE